MKHILATQDIQHVIDELESPDCKLSVESALVSLILCFSLKHPDTGQVDWNQLSALKDALLKHILTKPMVLIHWESLLGGASPSQKADAFVTLRDVAGTPNMA
jgi:hypothetical protein